MDDQTLHDHLTEIGLSQKEIETYLTVLEAGEAKVTTVAERSDVSQRYVYNIADELAERGLVELHDHVVPTKIRAIPPEEAIERLVGRLHEMEAGLESKYTEITPEESTFEVVKSRQTVVKKIRSLLSAAETEVFLTIPSTVTDDVLAEMRAATDRGVTVVLLEGAVEHTDRGDAERFAGAATVVRQYPRDTSLMVSADATSGLLGERQLLTGAHDERQAVVLTQSQIVGSLFGSFVSGFWSMGEEAFVADPVDLPRTYEMARPAVLQATRHLQVGNDIVAEVTGNPTDDEDTKTSFSGRVTGTKQGLLEPTTSDFPFEISLTVERADEDVSVGGVGAFVEDYSADEVTLAPAEE